MLIWSWLVVLAAALQVPEEVHQGLDKLDMAGQGPHARAAATTDGRHRQEFCWAAEGGVLQRPTGTRGKEMGARSTGCEGQCEPEPLGLAYIALLPPTERMNVLQAVLIRLEPEWLRKRYAQQRAAPSVVAPRWRAAWEARPPSFLRRGLPWVGSVRPARLGTPESSCAPQTYERARHTQPSRAAVRAGLMSLATPPPLESNRGARAVAPPLPERAQRSRPRPRPRRLAAVGERDRGRSTSAPLGDLESALRAEFLVQVPALQPQAKLLVQAPEPTSGSRGGVVRGGGLWWKRGPRYLGSSLPHPLPCLTLDAAARPAGAPHAARRRLRRAPTAASAMLWRWRR